MSHFRRELLRGADFGPVCFARPQACHFPPVSHLHRVSNGNANSEIRDGIPVGNASLSDRSSSTSAAPGRRWCLRGPRGARGLSDTSHTSNSWRCGDAAGACRDASCDSGISARNSNEGRILVLFGLQDLNYELPKFRGIFVHNIYLPGFGAPYADLTGFVVRAPLAIIFAPEGGFLGRVPRLQSNIQRQTFSKICEEQLHLNTTLVSTRACGYFLFKKRKKLLKNRVPEMSLLRASRSFFQDPLQILLTKHRMYLHLKPAQMPFGKSPPNLGQTDKHTNIPSQLGSWHST